jgi:hypothetical protein
LSDESAIVTDVRIITKYNITGSTAESQNCGSKILKFVKLSLSLIKHHAMKTYGGVDV